MTKRENLTTNNAEWIADALKDTYDIPLTIKLDAPIEGVPEGAIVEWFEGAWFVKVESPSGISRTRLELPYQIGDEVVLCEDWFTKGNGGFNGYVAGSENWIMTRDIFKGKASEMDPKDARWVGKVKDIQVKDISKSEDEILSEMAKTIEGIPPSAIPALGITVKPEWVRITTLEVRGR